MNAAKSPQFIHPAWPAPVRAVMTTRHGGISPPPYHSFNLGLNSGDDPVHVQENRRRLHRALNLPNPPAWLQQSHSIRVIPAQKAQQDNRADGSYTCEAGVVCTVLTADCMPVLLCDTAGSCVAAVHAGWRGLAGGILEAAVTTLPVAAETLLAWLGPAIGPRVFEVGPEVREVFMAGDVAAAAAFMPNRPGHYLCDLYQLARQRLAQAGVNRVYGGGFCTYTDAARFYSYRRDQQTTGRMAALIWLADKDNTVFRNCDMSAVCSTAARKFVIPPERGRLARVRAGSPRSRGHEFPSTGSSYPRATVFCSRPYNNRSPHEPKRKRP